MTPDWTLKKFNDLTPLELYDILDLRNLVFVVEQQCIFKETDRIDPGCHHLFKIKNNTVIACARLLPQGLMYAELSIGRVVTHPGYRGLGNGGELMRIAIETIHFLHGPHPIKIGAQVYLKSFYESFGFRACGDLYLEDGIQHIHMLLA
ncbi:MAG TPA: GNAT family N-acetyltransferase [Ohtaekwangia sp.]|nr:GNAT family N-acetyltransferase [Ohtaekwangia sp.]